DDAIALALRDAKERRVEIARQVAGGAPRVWVDRERIVQALANLIGNGIRFTPDDGKVAVRALIGPKGATLEVAYIGIGMSSEQRERLLSRAFVVRDLDHHHSSTRLDFGSAGLGLGVAIARGLVEAHGGTLSLESAPGAGCVAAIHLPPD